MKKINSTIIVLLIVSVVSLCLGIVSTVNTVQAGNDYKEGIRAYNQFADAEGSVIGDYAAKQAARAFSASKTADIIKKDLYKHFALSLLLYAVFAVSLVMAYTNYEKRKEE